MADVEVTPRVVPAEDSELIRYPDDEIWVRAADGDIQVVEYWSTDRQGPPPHSHPWVEVEMVIEGEVEFLVGDEWTRGGPGTVQLLPAGVPHSVRVPEGKARVVMVTIGPPFDGFGRDMARLFGSGAPLEEVVRVAAGHGVHLG